jgi:LMBR1 domain-containing protein 1
MYRYPSTTSLLYMVLKNSNGFPFTSFLNQIFLYFEYSVVSFLGTILLAFFCIYLLWATQKGNLKFGMRIPFLFTIHPMKYNSADMKYRVNETWMNTFLFNVSLILMASVSVT